METLTIHPINSSLEVRFKQHVDHVDRMIIRLHEASMAGKSPQEIAFLIGRVDSAYGELRSQFLNLKPLGPTTVFTHD